MATLSRSIRIDAPAATVWALLSDLPSMGERSPENVGGRWSGGATGPTVGATFTGVNRQGWRRWSTKAEVVRSVSGSEFAFSVRALGLAVADWAYEVEEEGAGGCTVTERWTDRRGPLLLWGARLITGVADREAYNAVSIEQTLASLKARAEFSGAAR